MLLLCRNMKIKKGISGAQELHVHLSSGQYFTFASIKSSSINLATAALGTVLDMVIACHIFDSFFNPGVNNQLFRRYLLLHKPFFEYRYFPDL